VDLWGKAKDLIKGNVITKVVDEMWTYLIGTLGPSISGRSLATCTLVFPLNL